MGISKRTSEGQKSGAIENAEGPYPSVPPNRGTATTNARSSCIAPRAAGRRHGRYKWAGQPAVPSGHEEETHGPAGHIGLRVRAGRRPWIGRTGERRRSRETSEQREGRRVERKDEEADGERG